MSSLKPFDEVLSEPLTVRSRIGLRRVEQIELTGQIADPNNWVMNWIADCESI
jgi:hypothetical protein